MRWNSLAFKVSWKDKIWKVTQFGEAGKRILIYNIFYCNSGVGNIKVAITSLSTLSQCLASSQPVARLSFLASFPFCWVYKIKKENHWQLFRIKWGMMVIVDWFQSLDWLMGFWLKRNYFSPHSCSLKIKRLLVLTLAGLTNTCIFPSGPWRLTDVSSLIEFSLFSCDMDLTVRGEEKRKTEQR